MTQSEFIEITSEIEKFYNTREDKKLTSEQMHIWFDELKNISKPRYRQIGRECYRTLKFFPKLADIVEINRNLAHETVEPIDDTVCTCNVCNGTGIVMYYRKIADLGDRTYQYAARCDCKNGLRYRNILSISELGLARNLY